MADGNNGSVLRSPGFWLGTLLAVAFIIVGTRTVLDPAATAAGWGMPVTGGVDAAFVQVYGVRNAALGLITLLFALSRMVRAMAILISVGVFIPAADLWIAFKSAGFGPHLISHAVIMSVLFVVAILLWGRVAAK
jgi:hypothetical protein